MLDLNALILTYNEAPNIGRTLDKLGWVPRIVVLDSGSTDQTTEIVQSFANTELYHRPFDDHTTQWNFGLHQCDIQSKWVLALDADYQITKELATEIQRHLSQNHITKNDAYWAHFKYALDGQIIESGIYPPVQILYKRDKANYEYDGHTQRIKVNGSSGWLEHPVVHDDRKSMQRWLTSQYKYAKLEAEKFQQSENRPLSKPDKLRKKSKLTPLLVFFYVLLYRGAWREGVPGWRYAYQRLIAEILIQYHLLKSN